MLDSLGGENLEKSLRVLQARRQGHRHLRPPPRFAGAAGLYPPVRLAIAALSAKIRRQAKKLGVSYEFLLMHGSGQQLVEITKLVDAGQLRTVVGKVFPFEQTPDAVAALAKGGTPGKVVVARG